MIFALNNIYLFPVHTGPRCRLGSYWSKVRIIKSGHRTEIRNTHIKPEYFVDV